MKRLRNKANVQTKVHPVEGRLAMFSRIRRLLLVASLVGLLACVAVATSATPAFAYGKATWQTALNGTFTFPGGGGPRGSSAEGFWGWCDFGGGDLRSGDDAECQIAEDFHFLAGGGWTCQLSIDGSWTQAGGFFGETFHMTGSVVVRGHLTASEQDACVGFFVTGDPTISYSGRTFANVDTFIPAAPGHYAIPPSFLFPDTNVVGEFHFQVNLNPTA
jgi:hypothetical protein